MVFTLRNQDLSRYAAISHPISVWTRSWFEPGEFELTIPYRANIEYEKLISKGIEVGIIRGILREFNDEDGDTMKISGPLLAGVLKDRIVAYQNDVTGTPEDVMKSLVYYQISDRGFPSERIIPGLLVDSDKGYPGSEISNQAIDVSLADEVQGIAEESGLGYDIVLDGSGLVFRVLSGVDRTVDQELNTQAIFSLERKNLLTVEFEEDGDKHTNCTFFNIGDDRYTVGTASGFSRREFVFSAPDVSEDENGLPNSEAKQISLLTDLAKQKMTPKVVSITARIDPEGNLKYKEHYDLGDICTCKIERWNVTANLRITKIKEVYAEDGFGLEVTFGQQLSYKRITRRIVNA